MENYDEHLKKIHDEKEELMKNATDNLMNAAFAKYDELEAKAEALRSEPENQIRIIDALNEAESCLQKAVKDFNKGDFESTVSHTRSAMKIFGRVDLSCEIEAELLKNTTIGIPTQTHTEGK